MSARTSSAFALQFILKKTSFHCIRGILFVPFFKRPLVLTILDGWGYRAETANNAIALARKPAYDKLLKKSPDA